MARRSNRTGTVVQRANGRWQGSIQIEGKRRTVYGKTKAEATRKLATLKDTIERYGDVPNPIDRDVNDLLDAFLESSTNTLRPRTIEHYTAVYKQHIRPAIGRVNLSRIAPYDIQRLYTALERKGYKRIPSQVHSMLHRAFRLAVLWNWVNENPCDRVIRPIHKAKRPHVWSQKQIDSFLDATRDHWLGPLWITLLGTGCRLGEALGLRWSDINEGVVQIERTLQRINREWKAEAPKTEAGERSITLPSMVVRALQRQASQQAEWRLKRGPEWSDTGLVFTNQQGDPIHRSVVSHAMTKACRRLELPHLSPHGLRHQSASMLVARGIPLPAVSKRLGHARVSITLDIYSHVIGGEDIAAANALDNVMTGTA